jgi:uncharacterized protein YgiM (DUF1202 family)
MIFNLIVRWLPEGSKVRVLEADDGSGWVKVIDLHGDSGLVPASYLEMLDTDLSRTSVHRTPRERGKVKCLLKNSLSNSFTSSTGYICIYWTDFR